VVVLQEFAETVPNINEVLNAAEIFWIAELRRRGCPLTNCTDGGGGQVGFRRPDIAERNRARVWTPQQREKCRRAHLGTRDTPETRMKKAASSLGKRHTPETRAKLSAQKRLFYANPIERARLADANRGKRHTAESKEKIDMPTLDAVTPRRRSRR
jgi:hypothetical protein